MGNKLVRRQDAPLGSAENAAAQQAAEEPVASQPKQDSGRADVCTEDLDVVVGEATMPVVRLPSEACVSAFKEVDAPDSSRPPNEANCEPVSKETPDPVPSEPLASLLSEASSSEAEPVAEGQVAAEAAPDTEPEPEEAEADAESAPAPVEAPEKQTETPLPDPALIGLDVSEATPQPITSLAVADPVPAPISPDEPSDTAATDESQDSTKGSIILTPPSHKSEETSESPGKPTEAEAAGGLEQFVGDVGELLQDLTLKGTDLVADLVPTDVQISEDESVTDTSA